jgi:gag-polypeptide of LTR copia-type
LKIKKKIIIEKMSSTSKFAMEVSTRVLMFSGRAKDFPPWEEKYKARETIKGLGEMLVLPKGVVIPKASDELDPNDPDEAKLIELREKNKKAYSNLVCSMDTGTAAGNVAFQLVRSSKSVDYPDGHTPTSWEKLMGKYRPKTAPTLTKLHREFYAMAMSAGQNPDVFLVKLEYQRMLMEQMESKMTDDQFLMHVVNVLPTEYNVVVFLEDGSDTKRTL